VRSVIGSKIIRENITPIGDGNLTPYSFTISFNILNKREYNSDRRRKLETIKKLLAVSTTTIRENITPIGDGNYY